MNYAESREYIGHKRFAVKLGLEYVSELLEALGNPQNTLKIVHVAGTNGKGSTCAYIERALREAGYRVGLFTSPYVFEYLERVRIDGKNVDEGTFARLASQVRIYADRMEEQGRRHPTAFEMELAIALLWFAEMRCDYVVLEVGLGGRLDATNAVKHTLLSVITTIGLDHTAELGDTLEKIAQEKAAIIKPHGAVVVARSSVLRVIEQAARDARATLTIADEPHNARYEGETLAFELGGRTYKTALLGAYQAQNAALAIAALHTLKSLGVKLCEDDIERGIETACWNGRFQKISASPMVILDGAHNPNGAQALRDTLEKLYPQRKIIFVLGMLKDKDWKSVADILYPIAERFFLLTPNSERALAANTMREYLQTKGANATTVEYETAMITALNGAKPDDIVVVCGSLTFLGDVKRTFE